jgi:hypothetical protein
MKKYFLPASLVLVGVVVSGVILYYSLWNWLEPVTGVATLVVASLGWLRSYRFERELGAVMEQKTFEITLGLRRGYLEGAQEHSFAEAENAYRKWMQSRVDGGKRFVTGLLDTMTLTFPVRNGEGNMRVTQEPGVVLSGSLSPHYDKGRADSEVSETLTDLAKNLGSALGQVRVYVAYQGRQWTVEM